MATTIPLTDKDLLENILKDYASIPYAHGDLQLQFLTDPNNHRYLLLTMGWDGERRVHHILGDVELRGDKFWIHRDGTEDGIATDLERAGIPKNRIVLAWHPEEVRHLTEYAVK